ncbi:hypothetical protein SteCoe_23457 [Stentor coeruleus]|uniref:Uncharacterized protein n=1 Tax=Stentor coeruleus TaxID=5963 RepID=A0A1R2BKB6_9CILI|nr:hypothetical protein SteCoe_23457 [Stentor coeruleus]
MSGDFQYNEDFSFQTTDFQTDSKAAANAIRALQGKIQSLETERENLQNHINYLLSKNDHSEKGRISPILLQENTEKLSIMTERIHELNNSYEIAQQKINFLERELRRKDQQYLLDKDTWELERKALIKEQEKNKGLMVSPNQKKLKKSGKRTEDTRVQELIRQIEKLSYDLKASEMHSLNLEDVIHKSRKDYDRNLSILQEELVSIKKAVNINPMVTQELNMSNEYLELQKELDYYKNLDFDQKSHIQELTNEVESLKLELAKYENPEPVYVYDQTSNSKVPDSSIEDINALEESVNRLSYRYKALLERTRNTRDNYPELREDLKNTALELEVQSHALYNLRMANHDNFRDRFQDPNY